MVTQKKLDHLYDPKTRRKTKMARRRRRTGARRGRMPAGLRRYWASRRRYDPRRRSRRVRRRRYDPYIPYDPGRRTRRFRRRRYDFMGRTGIIGSFMRLATVTLGGILHNWLVTRGIMANTRTIGGVTMSDAGIALGSVGVIAEGMRWPMGETLAHIGAGAFTEGFTAPALEGVAKAGVVTAARGNGGLGDSYIPMGAYATAL